MQPAHSVPISPFTGIPGWETDQEEVALRYLAEQVQGGGWIVEIGSEFGRSAAAFLSKAQRTATVVSVDLFPEDHPQVGDLRGAYASNITEAGFSDRRLMIIRSDSAEAGANWQFGGIDLLFIDGDHTYDGVMRDIKAWVHHVKPGGTVAFHDCAYGDDPHVLHLEVSRAVDEWFDNRYWIYAGQFDSLRVYRKR